jgi:hypothetical protein
MKRKSIGRTTRRFSRSGYFMSAFALIALVLGLAIAPRPSRAKDTAAPQALQTVFTNSAPITINDDDVASPYPSNITVSGLSGTIPATPGSVKVTFHGWSHSFPDDVGMVLKGPTGAALLLQDGVGEGDPETDVTYTLSDDGAAQMPDDAWGPGTYKPTAYYTGDSFPSPGPLLAYNHPGPAMGGGTATFTSTFGGTNPNGVWSLYVVDFVAGDEGVISGGWSIDIAGAVTPPEGGHPVFDFDGDGKSDYGVNRVDGGNMSWYLQRSTGGFTGTNWGSASDIPVPGDYDGDNKWDIAIWRPGTPGIFYILQSGTNALQVVAFGQTGDDPRITQDYDGDGKVDPSVARSEGGTLSFYSQRTTAGFTGVAFGNAATDVPIRGDFDGDGKADIGVYRGSTGSPANAFFIIGSSNGALISQSWGNGATDYVVPADFDGDHKTDFAVWRGKAGGDGGWYWLASADSSFHATGFGLAAVDVPAPGDYDGDGKTDQAVWRTGAPGVFFTLGSTSGFTGLSFGQAGDTVPGFTLQAR